MITIDVDKLLEGLEPVALNITKPEDLFAYVQACDDVLAKVRERLPEGIVLLGDINSSYMEDWSTLYPDEKYEDTLTSDEHGELYDYLVKLWHDDICVRLGIVSEFIAAGVLTHSRILRHTKKEWPYKVWCINSDT